MIPGSAPPAGVPLRPALSPWCRLVEDGDRVLVEHGGTVVTLEGRAVQALLPRLLPLLDGTRTVDEVVEALGRPVAPAVDRALGLLAENRLLVDGVHREPDADPVTAAASFAAAVTRHTTQADARGALTRATVVVAGTGSAAAEIRRQLRRIGIGSVHKLAFGDMPEGDAFLVAAPRRDEVTRLAALNAAALELRLPWLQVLPFDGRLLIVGPLFLPGASACRACYLLRRGACSGYEDDFDRLEREPVRAPSPPPLDTFAAALAALLTLRWLTTCDPSLPGRFYLVETGSIVRLSYDHVLRVPRCATCGVPERAIPSPWFEAET